MQRLGLRKDVNQREISLEKRSRKEIYPFDKLFESFFNFKVAEGLAKGTLDIYERVYRNFTEFLINNYLECDFRQINVDIARNYVVWLLEGHVKFDGHKFKQDKRPFTTDS
ncbi:phage integrase SAM-like domain-containing protein [Cytobacillus suaedae]|nr:phage integrase SAM-like domain-containing protein [Cytobacillus suaedae]